VIPLLPWRGQLFQSLLDLFVQDNILVLHDYVPEETTASLALQETPRIEDDVGQFRAREHGQPGDDGVGQEVVQ